MTDGLASWDEVVAYALTLPNTERGTCYGKPAVKAHGKLLVATTGPEGSFVVPAPHDEKAVLLENDPETFWQTPHYDGWPSLLVRFGSADPERVRRVIARAWWDKAPARQRKAFGERP